ncbi:hypothetical protein GPECTOR_12g471 [Gonium pectorale]|uniref:Dynamin-type G domain-containing protein n=1 Tax=Gonium pectorale TaxID=33097 RepID=A0A150GP42_GONPE|nr:hypothetical protein GPECTOR_12g471 [Gonium pectorale]|eukprot:KXZ51508.1 hypothetical protein GPECTOR_12g471 [Gonium pectorale]
MAFRDDADGQDQVFDRSSRSLLKGHERLYDAYNELHALAQSFNKPFDAPAILVVGHQTDGKSALIEALMGFQFNSVGGGTKTRRPIAINMKYNGSCSTPSCYLKLEDGITEQEMSLQELQAYIDADNAMLEREQRFASREIVVRMEYKHCPNLTIIDTPGLISPAPGKKNCALQNCAAQVPEYVILCLEDCSDWSNATTRRLVMQVDPNLSRTVLVSTKFDTRIPQFARAADCEMFLKPSALDGNSMLGDAPFFTSVPSGRVGTGSDCVFPTHDAFRERLTEREATDVADLEAKLGRRLSKAEREHIGVGSLRRFLEQLLQKRYLDAVPAIVPVLEQEQRSTQQLIDAVRKDLVGLNPDELKDKGRAFVDAFLNRLQQLLRGTITAPADKFGETLTDEHSRPGSGGAFASSSSRHLQFQEPVPNANMRLYGGAQFHRAMSEFRMVVGALNCPELSHEEIVNACGLDYEGGHDGVNYVRTACVIAVSKAQELLQPYIHQLGSRLAHVLRRLLNISLTLMRQQHPVDALMGSGANSAPPAALTDQFVRRVSQSFCNFLVEVEDSCKARCLEDLASTTRYVSWSLHTRNSKNLKQMLGRVRVSNTGEGGAAAPGTSTIAAGKASGGSGPLPLSREPSVTNGGAGGGSLNLSEMLEATLWNRNLTGVSEDIVRALVFQMFEGIRDHLVQAAELKFNCFFLMPLVDSFPARLRKEIECAYEEGLDDVFDAVAVRSALENRHAELQEELRRVERLQRKFHSIHSTLVHGPSLASGPTSRAIDLDASIMLASIAASPLQPALAQQAGGSGTPGFMGADGQRQPGGRLLAAAAAAAGRTPELGPKSAMVSASPPLMSSAGRKPTASAVGAAAVAAGGAGVSLAQQARALAQQRDYAPGAGGMERDRGERDAKDKPLAGGEKVGLAAQQLQGASMSGY